MYFKGGNNMSLYMCQKVYVRNSNKVDYYGDATDAIFSYQLSENALKFVKDSGENVRAFVVDRSDRPKILLFYNMLTKETYIPEEYEEDKRSIILQKFNKFLLLNPKITYASSEI